MNIFQDRRLGGGEWHDIPLAHVARAVHSVTLPVAPTVGDGTVEYYIEAKTAAGKTLRWPDAAPAINQTVVVIPAVSQPGVYSGRRHPPGLGGLAFVPLENRREILPRPKSAGQRDVGDLALGFARQHCLRRFQAQVGQVFDGRAAADHGVKLLLEPHGKYTDSVSGMEKLLDACASDALGVNLDTGNLWIGGGDPVEFVQKLGKKIKHVHWKDMGEEWLSKRGTLYGTGMGLIPLGSGLVDIKGTYAALVKAGFDGHTTLEVAGDEAVMGSYAYLKSLGAE